MKSSKTLALLVCMLTALVACSRESVSPPTTPVIAGLTRADLALFQAVDDGDVKKIRSFISHGANVNIRRRPWNMTPLLFSIQKRADVAKVLVESGADVNAADRDGATALMKAVQIGNLQTVKLLLKNGAKTETRDRFDETALIYAVVLGRIDIMNTLIRAGADVNVVRYTGNTLLVLAKNMTTSAREMKHSQILRHKTGHQKMAHQGQHDHGKKNTQVKKDNSQQNEKIVSSLRYNKNSGLTPHKHYAKSSPRHKPEIVTKKQLIAERKQITVILAVAGAKAKTFKPRPSPKSHH